MKKLIFPLILILIFFCGCSNDAKEANRLASEELLYAIVNTIDIEELKDTADEGIDAITEKFPALEPVTSREDMSEFLGEHGISLMRKYLDDSNPKKRTDAEKLGDIIKILTPELTDEVDAVLAQ